MEVFVTSKGDRQGVPNILILLTDGRPQNLSLVRYHAINAENAGIQIFVVGKW